MSVWDLHSLVSRSRIQRRWMLTAYLIALPAIFLAVLPHWIQGLMCLVWLVSAILSWRGLERATQDSILEFHWTEDDAWIVMAGGQRLRVTWDRCTVWSRLVVLPLKARDSGWKETLVLFPDSLPENDYRRLLVRLRLGNPQQETNWI